MWFPFTVVLLLSFGICAIVVFGKKGLAGGITRRDDLRARQRAHSVPTPRVGGVGVLAGMIAALLLVPGNYLPFFALFVTTLIPVFVAGLAEDLGFRISPTGRLAAAVASAALAVALLGVWIPPEQLWPLDLVLALPLVAITATILLASGICHSFNLIDGVNGLAAGLAAVIATGLWLVAQKAGAPMIGTAAFLLIPALLGFLLLNWPWGRIFLGDAGAYGIGHVLIWLAIILTARSQAVSGLAMALMFFWPVADTFLAIWRRRRRGMRVDVPDRMHFHQLVFRALVLTLPERVSRTWANSLTALLLMPLAAMPVAAAVLLWDRPLAALLAWIGFAVLFVGTYLLGMRLFLRRRPRLASLAPQLGLPLGMTSTDYTAP